MELVQQGIELLFGDLVIGLSLLRIGLALFLQRIEHGIELLIGAAAGGGFRFRGLRSSGGVLLTRRTLAGLLLCWSTSRQLLQRSQQLRTGGAGLLSPADALEHLVEHIHHRENDIHQRGVHLAFAIAQEVEYVFRTMTDLHQRDQVEESGPSLDGVKSTENSVEQRIVFRILLQLYQLLPKLLQNLACLDQKVLQDLFVCIKCHFTPP